MSFSISSKLPFLFGSGSAALTGTKAAEFGWKKIILVYDPGVKAAGLTDAVEKSLADAGIGVVVFDGVVPDPPDTVVEAAAELARREDVDGVVAIGGGSALDVGKCVSLLLTNPSPVGQYYGAGKVPNPPKGSILLPTTAGTGSETSDTAILTNTELGVKMGIASEYSKAKLAIVDPVLTYGLPKSLTGSTAMDAFAHGYEAFTGLMHNPVSDLYAEKTMRLVVDNLPLVMADPGNTEARDALMLAATIGGMSFGDSMVHLGHNIGQNIGTLAHTPHGVSCMLGVLAAIEYLAPAVPEKTAFVGALFGLDPLVARSHEALGRETAARYKAFLVSCGLPATLRELGVQESVLEPAAKLIEEDFILQPCAPRKPDAAEALALLKKIF